MFVHKIISKTRPIHIMYSVLFLGLALTFASFFIEYVLGKQPCPMCLWQRYSHIALWLVALIAISLWRCIKHPKLVLVLFVLIGLYSGGVGLYQGLGQQGIVELPKFCTGGEVELAQSDNLLTALEHAPKPVSCADTGFTILGLTLAWWNFIIMTVMLYCLIAWLVIHRRFK